MVAAKAIASTEVGDTGVMDVEGSPRTPNRPRRKNKSMYLSPSSSFGSNYSSSEGSPSSSLVKQWSKTPPTSPSKLRSEYQSRINSPSKRRTYLERRMSIEASSFKSSNSPLSLRRSLSDGLTNGDRFIPLRVGAQMEIAYSMMGEDVAASPQASSPFRGPERAHSTLHSSSSFSALPRTSVATSSSHLFSSTSFSYETTIAAMDTGASNPATTNGTSSPTVRSSSFSSPAAGGTSSDAVSDREPILNLILRSELLGMDSGPPALHPSAGEVYRRERMSEDGGGSGSRRDSFREEERKEEEEEEEEEYDSRRTTTHMAMSMASHSIGRSAGVKIGSGGVSRYSNGSSGGSPGSPGLLQFKPARERPQQDPHSSFSLLPMETTHRRLLSSPLKAKRKVSKTPFKVLDAPALQDDFYLNLVDWSSMNVLAVGLGTCVYLWSACTSTVTKLCDLGGEDAVSSVAWAPQGSHLAVGTSTGEVQVWDVDRCQQLRSLGGHSARVGTMSWNGQLLATGSRDRLICMRDLRAREPRIKKLHGHRQEVCGLRWSFDECHLASGGNDNKLYVWNQHSSQPIQKFAAHTAAVKALAWSPHQSGLLASGGGTADRHIRFWNTLTGTAMSEVDTGSQVCNLMWSRNVNEIVSTHGYSLNQIILWKYPSMAKVATLTGHTFRVLYLAMSPDGQTIVTGAGDETLRFWNAFPGAKNTGNSLGTSLLFPVGHDIR